MLAIRKNIVNPLRQYYDEPNACYEDMPSATKVALQESLLEEQGYLCAYCMGRINKKNMHIEHWFPRNPDEAHEPKNPAEEKQHRRRCIDYKNLLAVCAGNTGRPLKEQHCDKSKGKKLLRYNPADPSDAAKLRIYYSKSTGEIASADVGFDCELNDVLHLNLDHLKLNRKNVISSMNGQLHKLGTQATVDNIERMLKHSSF